MSVCIEQIFLVWNRRNSSTAESAASLALLHRPCFRHRTSGTAGTP